MSDIPNSISIRELRQILDDAEKQVASNPESTPVLVEVEGRKKPLMITGEFEIDYGMVLVKVK